VKRWRSYIFFGLTGTVNDTSADQTLLNWDDEQWLDIMVYLIFEGGCYAKVIDRWNEPDIWLRIKRDGKRYDEYGDVDTMIIQLQKKLKGFFYPIYKYSKCVVAFKAIIMQVNYLFICRCIWCWLSFNLRWRSSSHHFSDFTLQTERGITEPQPSFSCFWWSILNFYILATMYSKTLQVNERA
jgi:hypothetical protein